MYVKKYIERILGKVLSLGISVAISITASLSPVSCTGYGNCLFFALRTTRITSTWGRLCFRDSGPTWGKVLTVTPRPSLPICCRYWVNCRMRSSAAVENFTPSSCRISELGKNRRNIHTFDIRTLIYVHLMRTQIIYACLIYIHLIYVR